MRWRGGRRWANLQEYVVDLIRIPDTSDGYQILDSMRDDVRGSKGLLSCAAVGLMSTLRHCSYPINELKAIINCLSPLSALQIFGFFFSNKRMSSESPRFIGLEEAQSKLSWVMWSCQSAGIGGFGGFDTGFSPRILMQVAGTCILAS